MRTEYCGQLRLSHVGQQVTLCGWVNRRRDLGSLIFIDMRDREGIVQVFFDPDRADALKLASELRNELNEKRRLLYWKFCRTVRAWPALERLVTTLYRA